MTELPRTRQEAKLLGVKRYLPDVPCKRGHQSARYALSGHCVICDYLRRKAWISEQPSYEARRYAKRRDTSLAAAKAYRLAHLDDVKAKAAARYAANPTPVKRRAAVFATKNPKLRKQYCGKWRDENRDHHNSCNAEWAKANPERRAAIAATRRAIKKQACPAWIDHEALTEIYLRCPDGYVVDHIIALKDRTACGLHAPWNLQYLRPRQNEAKGNRRITIPDAIPAWPLLNQ